MRKTKETDFLLLGQVSRRLRRNRSARACLWVRKVWEKMNKGLWGKVNFDEPGEGGLVWNATFSAKYDC